MSIPVLVRLYRKTRDEAFLEDAILQSERFHHYLFRKENELYHHCMYPDSGRYGVAHWSRANGWAIMARVQLMDFLPEGHPYRKRLKEILLDQIIGLSRFQGPDGLWHQLLDKPDSFPESSGTSMFVYAIARSVNEGWIPDHYSSIALRGWEGLEECVNQAGELDKVSLGFNIRQDLPFYYNQPIEPGGAHGLGAFLLAGLEISRMKPYRDCLWC
jgi:rhamnogalacturonyl hydrolase YesR